MPRRDALIVANDLYLDPELARLRAPGPDAEELAAVLRAEEIGGFQVRVCLNQSHPETRLAVEDLFADRGRGDLLLLHFACHGIKDEAGRLFFATTDTRIARLNATGISAEYINNLLNECRSRRIVLLLDCCYSGAFTRGLQHRSDQQVGVRDYFEGRGRAVLTASNALEYAWEGDTLTEFGHGSAFTGAIVRGLRSGEADRDRDGLISVDELYDYVFDEVRKVTPNQTPGKWSNVEGTLIIARSVRGPAPSPDAVPWFAGDPGASQPTPDPNKRRQAAFRCSYSFPKPVQLVGRDAQLARLRDVLDRAQVGGQMVFISAAAGTGKSALAGKLVEVAQSQGVLCLAGGSYDKRFAVPLGSIQEALTDYRLATGSDAGPELDILDEMQHARAAPSSGGTDSELAVVRLFGIVLSFFITLAMQAQTSLLLCLEDLHAADAATLRLIHYLASQTRRVPILVLGTFRVEDADRNQPLSQLVRALVAERLAEEVHLEPLGPAETRRLVTTLVGHPVADSVSKSLYETTEGNPLFIEQFVTALRAAGQLGEAVQTLGRRALSGPSLPSAIRELVDQGMSRVSAQTQKVLESAAALGSMIDYTTLLSVVEPMSESDLLTHLDEAIRNGLLRETTQGYAFSHALIRDGVYWGLSRPRRMLLHGRIGMVLETLSGPEADKRAAELAYHFSLAGHAPAMRMRALKYSITAGRAAAALSADGEAFMHFSTACELLETWRELGDSTALVDALAGRGLAERHLAMWSACMGTFEKVLGLSSDPVMRAQAREALATALQHLGQTADALAQVDGGLTELRAITHPDSAAAVIQLQYAKALLHYLPGAYVLVREVGDEMLRTSETAKRDILLYRAQTVLGWACMGQGDVEAGIAHYSAALAAAERASHQLGVAVTHENLGMQLLDAGEFEWSHGHLDQAVMLFQKLARDVRAMSSLQVKGRVYLAQGDLAKARQFGELARSFASQEQDRRQADCEDLLGRVCTLEADWDAAVRHFQVGQSQCTSTGYMLGLVQSLTGLGLVHERRGDWASADDLYRRAVSVANAADPGPHVITAHAHLGRLMLRRASGNGRESVERSLAAAEQMPEAVEGGLALLGMTEHLAAQHATATAISFAERALAQSLPISLAAEINAFLARLLLRRGDVSAAATHAAEAMLQANQVGGPVLLGLAWLSQAEVTAAQNLDDARRQFETALDYLPPARAPYERGLVLDAWARTLEHTGDHSETVPRMRAEASTLFQRVGGRPLLPD